MSGFNAQVDAYIAQAQPFAQPILAHLRMLVHKACPTVEEKIKWGMPCFDYKGMLCNMAAFKKHCSFGFWKASIMMDSGVLTTEKQQSGMGQLGKLSSLEDLPADQQIISYLKEAMQLNEQGIKVPKRQTATKTTYVVPAYITTAIKKNKQAFATWEAFAPSHRKEYATWIDEAKTAPTQAKRIAQTIEWLIEGKSRNWKYEQK